MVEKTLPIVDDVFCECQLCVMRREESESEGVGPKSTHAIDEYDKERCLLMRDELKIFRSYIGSLG